ncbi:MAG: glycine cleavage system aminomethyltransferase GcvT [Candidatus Zixiibacteriota bacterium]|nr:MAG: glycine cleavage system aminomethyltransferase GcvT [candidate division Zixibacteria bacterium]
MKTALYDIHAALGGKIVPFAGYLMPIQYPRGIVAEHRRVRTTVGVFDVSHMGEFFFSGPDAEKFLNWITINDVSKLAVWQAQYSAFCYPDGGMVDDLLVYRFPDRYMMVVNAANLAKDRDWVLQHLPKSGVEFADRSDDYTLLAVQGPRTRDLLKPITGVDLDALAYYHLAEGKVAGLPAVVARTGYTGELGYEVMVENRYGVNLWEAIFEAGKPYEVEPIGLGARDTLRLEMKYCLYGNDIDATTHPLEAGLGWITKLNKGDFIGREAILAAKEKGLTRTLVGFVVEGKGLPRHGTPILKDGITVGVTTSGNYSPMLDRGIGLGYVPVELSAIGTELELDLRGRTLPLRLVKTPFYQPQPVS